MQLQDKVLGDVCALKQSNSYFLNFNLKSDFFLFFLKEDGTEKVQAGGEH